jgi:6-phosphogluconolactonase
VNELSSTVCVFDVDPDTGALVQVQEVSTLPPDYSAGNTAAEIAVHPSGNFVYVSNRGHDSIAVFARDEKTGLLTSTGHFDATGPTPRHLVIDPTGRWCLVAVQDGNYVSSFALDDQTGLGRYTDSVERITAPTCIVFSEHD